MSRKDRTHFKSTPEPRCEECARDARRDEESVAAALQLQGATPQPAYTPATRRDTANCPHRSVATPSEYPVDTPSVVAPSVVGQLASIATRRTSEMGSIYTAVIIGAGRIASGFDTPRSREILTHAHAYSAHPRTVLKGITDIDKKRGIAAARKWSTAFFSDCDAMFASVKPDIISIATPDETHFAMLMKAMKYHPKLILCEKPVVSTAGEADRLAAAARKSGIPILVNYPRRFERDVQEIRAAIARGAFGNIVSGRAIYSKGTVHNGSHVIDLCRYFFGELKSFSVHYRINDYKADDPITGAFLTFERCPQFYLIAGDERAYSSFEFDVVGETKRATIVNEGFEFLTTEEVRPDPIYAGYRILKALPRKKMSWDRALYAAVGHAVAHLEKKTPLISDVFNAIKTHRACLALVKQKIKII